MNSLTYREMYGFGNGASYRKRYSSQSCRGASFYFLDKIMKNQLIDVNHFNIREIELMHKNYVKNKTVNDLNNDEVNKFDTLELVNKYSGSIITFKWFNLSPSDYTMNRNVIIEELGKSLYPCGTIHLRDHAMAYGSDDKYLYLYDPDFGLMRFMRNREELNEFFSAINERNNLKNISLLRASTKIRVNA